MTQNDTSFRMSVFWMPREYAICKCAFTTILFYDNLTMYDIKAVNASFLCKLQLNFAPLQYFPIHTTKRVVLRFHKMNTQLWLAKNS
jgi:hypothetical protein